MRSISICISICLLALPPLGASLVGGGEKPHRLEPRPARPNVEVPVQDRTITLAEVTVTAGPPEPRRVRAPARVWSCSGWIPSQWGGSYRKCGWK